MSRIFISHSSSDNVEAVAMRDWLACEGWDDIFLDLDPDRGIAAGERWEQALYAAAHRCEAVVFLISVHWLASGWCLKEYALARSLNKRLFAAIIDPAKRIDDLPPELTGTWQAVDLTAGQQRQAFRVAVPGASEQRVVAFSRDGLRRLRNGLAKAGLDPKFFAWPPAAEPGRAPYRGLQPLGSVDAGIFFGRDAPIIEATDLLRGLREAAPPRLLVILGASGAGKSSFLRAGLLPRLARDDSHFLTLPVIRPERAALFGENGFLGALAATLPERTQAELRAAIQAGAVGLRPLFAQCAALALKRTLADEAAAKPPAIIVAVDQAEELFRSEGAAEGTALLALLRDLTVQDDPATIILFAIRSDAYDQLQHAAALEGVAQRTLPLQPMPRSAYKDVIEGPARRLVEAGGQLTIEPRLTQRLLEDIEKGGGGSDALPLLAFTLEQLWLGHRQSGALRLAHYEASGGLKGAVEAAVARAFVRADADPRLPRDRPAREALLRRGFIPWLAGIDPDTKIPRRNIARRADIPAEAAPLIELLVEERLLAADTVTARDPQTGVETRTATIEPAHESLLRQWGLLQGWLEDDFGQLATLEGVKRAARDWEANTRSAAWLAHQGQRLAEGQGIDARPDIAARLDPVDRAYLAACRTREEAIRAAEQARQAEREAEQARQLRDAQAVAAADRRTARRTRIGLVVALVLAAAAAAFGVLAMQQRAIADRRAKEAQVEQARAERALGAATETANTLTFDLAQRLRHAVGMPASLVKSILDPVLKLQDSLIGSGETVADLRRSQSAALSETVATFLMVGDIPGAMKAAVKAVAIVRRLAEEQPAVARWQRDLSVSLNNLGDVRERAGDRAGALAAYTESLAIRRVLARQHGDAQAQRDVLVSLNNIGEAKLRAGDRAGALAACRESLAIARALAKNKGERQAQRDLALGLDRIADLQQLAGERAGALAAYAESLAIRRELAKDKGDGQAQRDLSTSLEKIGDLKLLAGDRVGAQTAYEESLAIVLDLAKDKGNAQAQRDLSITLDKIGDLKKLTGDRSGALAAYAKSLTIRRDLAADKGDAQAQRDLSISLEKIGDLKLLAGDRVGAQAAYEESLGIVRRLAGDKGNAQAQRDLSESLEKIGDLKLEAGDRAGALAAYTEDLAISRAFAEDKQNAQAQRDLAASLDRIGDIKLHDGDRAGALAAYAESLAIRREQAKDRGHAQAQRALAVSLGKIGTVKLRDERPAALAAYRESLSIFRALARDKGNAQAQRELSVALNKLGDAAMKTGERAEAAAAYEEGLGIARALAQDKGNAQAQLDLAISLYKLAAIGSETTARLSEAIALLKVLDGSGRLPPDKKGWIAGFESALDAARKGR